MIKGIAHTAYNVTDMARSLEYYCEVLGFKKAFSIPGDDEKPWIEYLKVADGMFIELFYNRKDDSMGSSYSHLCLEVDDIQEIAHRLVKMGAPLESPPRQGKDTNWQCWSRDPDGNRIEFMQMNPTSPQSLA